MHVRIGIRFWRRSRDYDGSKNERQCKGIKAMKDDKNSVTYVLCSLNSHGLTRQSKETVQYNKGSRADTALVTIKSPSAKETFLDPTNQIGIYRLPGDNCKLSHELIQNDTRSSLIIQRRTYQLAVSPVRLRSFLKLPKIYCGTRLGSVEDLLANALIERASSAKFRARLLVEVFLGWILCMLMRSLWVAGVVPAMREQLSLSLSPVSISA